MDNNFPFVTRQDILNFPFPYKLWLVVNLEHCDFIRWNRDGTVILLDLVALEDYLNSSRSIFKIKNNSSFLHHLNEFRFERLNATPEAEEDLLLQYKNENFQRYRLDLLAKIRRHTYHLIGQTPAKDSVAEGDNREDPNFNRLLSDRMLGDLCFMFHGGLSKIKKSRLRFQTLLHFHNEKRILRQKLKASESAQIAKSKANNSFAEEDQVIELPVELFENPHDSVLNLGDDFRPEYAGYYGNCSKEQVVNFFGEYLPMFEDGSMEVKKVVPDNSRNLTTNNPPITTETSNPLPYASPDVAGKDDVFNISNPLALNSLYNLNFSSNLEPIYMTNENSENINPNTNNSNQHFTITEFNSTGFDNETDISMEEFIKFKNKVSESVTLEGQDVNNFDRDGVKFENFLEEQMVAKPFPQMPASVQVEITEDVKENEANFRNFFSQYRASLNLLYERQ